MAMDSTRTTDLMTITGLVRNGLARTRSEIAGTLAMRSTTVSELVGDLVAEELLLEVAVKPKGRGRPAAALRFNDQRFGAIFIGVVDRRLVAKAVDMGHRVLAELDCDPGGDADNRQMAKCIGGLVRKMADSFPAGIEIGTVVLSLSGLLDVPRKIWCVSSRWPNMSNLSLADALADVPWPIILKRNLDAELAGIRIKERHTDTESALLLHWGFGIGAAFSTDGEIVNRNRGRFCEIGHWGLGNAEGRPCTCGNHDCLETVAALWALGPVLRAENATLPLDESSLGSALRHVDPMSSPAMREALSQVLRLTANLCRLFFPDRIVLTGPFVQNPDIFRQFVDAVASAPLVKSLDKVRVSINEIGQQDEVVGALSGPFDQCLADYLASRASERRGID